MTQKSENLENSDTIDVSEKEHFQWSKKNIFMSLTFTLIVIISIYVFVLTIIDKTFLFENIRDYFILPLLDIGFWAVFVFLFLMVLQSLIAPIPSELVLLSGAMIFGFWGGVILGVIGSMLSAAVLPVKN